ncbi:ankyrin repeat-containing domain protein [Dichotomocladium elegans]|nr:ankyrin repeat-containing domain protein [Dichotomocladium elegans]
MVTTAIHQAHRPQQQHQQQCGSASCCSPLRIWRTVQIFIQEDNKDDFIRLCERTPTDVMVRVLLNSRVSNNPTLYSPSQKSRVIQFSPTVRQEAVRKFGKSATDLNAVQLALLTHSHKSSLALTLLTVLKQHATPAESRLFVNHVWGQGNTTLHLACFFNLPHLVRLLLDMGANPTARNIRMFSPVDLATGEECLAMMTAKPIPPHHHRPQPPPSSHPKPLAASSVLLRKAAEKRHATLMMTTPPPSPGSPITMTIPDEYFVKPAGSPHAAAATANVRMTFSSSSSSSSFSSLSSIDEDHKDDDCWTPPPSPITHQWVPSLSPSPPQHDMYRVPESPPSPVLERPVCVPSICAAKKQVRFDPQVMLIDACIRGDMQELSDLLGTDIYQGGGVGGVQNRSLLQIALMRGHEKLVRYLVDRVDVDHKDNDGWTALHYAAALGLWRSLEYLVGSAQANLDAKTNDGRTIYDCPDTLMGRRKCRSK